MSNTLFNYTFPAVRGTQAGRPCYITMCQMRIIPKIFIFNEEEVPVELRAQRILNSSRVPEMSSYLVDNPLTYTLSSITASISDRVKFTPAEDTGLGQNIGTLSIPMDAQILINDGQHRRAAIQKAILENPELGYDNISVLFFIDEGLKRSQQMFADLNKHAVRPSDSISTLYDIREALSDLARYTQKNVYIFSRMTEMEKSSISNRSTKLFTLSSIKNACKTLLKKKNKETITDAEKEQVVEYWNEVSVNMLDWQLALQKKVATSELREQNIHSHGVMLQAMGNIGLDLLKENQPDWKQKLKKLQKIDWARANPDWEGRAMNNGRISKSLINVVLTGNYIKMKLDVPLNAYETKHEQEYRL